MGDIGNEECTREGRMAEVEASSPGLEVEGYVGYWLKVKTRVLTCAIELIFPCLSQWCKNTSMSGESIG